MLIKRIEINHCVQLITNGITHFEWTPIEGMTGILGSNGSGKTTVVTLASPLSGTREFFKEGGGVEVVYEHNGQEVIVGYKHEKGKLIHHFIVDGEEMNRGGTGKEQDDLAESFFGYTKTIHQCLTGQLKFSRLGPAKRAQLLQEVVSIDVTQAEAVHDHLRKHLSKTKANFNHVSDKIIGLQQHVLKDEQISNNELIVEACSDGLEYLRKQGFTKSNHGHQALYQSWLQNNELLKVKSEEALKLQVPNKPDFCEEGQELVYQLHSLEHNSTFLNENITAWSNEFLQVNESLVQQGVNSEDLEASTAATIRKLEAAKTELVNDPRFMHWDKTELSQIVNGVTFFRDWVNNEFILSSDVKLKDLERNHFLLINEKYNTLNNRLRALTTKQQSGEAWLNKVRNTEKEKCPKCHHTYWRDFDPTEVERIETALAGIELEITSLTKEVESVGTEVNSVSNALNMVNTLYTQRDKLSPEVKPFITELLEVDHSYSDLLVNKPVLMSKINRLLNCLESSLERREVTERLDFNRQVMDKIITAKQANVYTQLSDRSVALESMVKEGVDKRQVLDEQIKVLSHYINVKERLVSLGGEIEGLLEAQLNITEEMLKTVEYEHSEEAFRHLQNKLANANEVLSKGRTSRHLLDEYVKDLDQLDGEIHCTAKLVDALSPTKGLIAKELTNGINQFTNLINGLLNELWDYDMSILPCNLDKGKLTYRFPMEVKGVSGLKDISDGSEGQQEIIDFIFSILYISQKGLKDFPLILDEPGRGLDHAHLNHFFAYIKQLSERGFCNQIFLISHVFGIMGDFADIDIVVMDADNVYGLNDLVYNEKVVMR